MTLDLAALTDALPSPQVAIEILLLVLVGTGLGKLVGVAIERTIQKTGNQAFATMAARGVMWTGFGLGLAAGLEAAGVDLSVLLGAAGVVSVGVGFASQTSASNLISGLFLVMERTVDRGDVIQVGGTSGEVLHVGLLSVRLRTFDNRFVRIPNETLMKAEIINISRFPIRRIAVELVVGPDADLDAVSALLRQAAADEPLVLQEPKPAVHVTEITDLGPRIVLWAWTTTGSFVAVRTALLRRVHVGMQAAGVPMATARQVVVRED